MKKVTGYIDVRALGRHKFEFYVDDALTDKEIKKRVYDECDFYVSYDVEDGYEEVTRTITEYHKRDDEPFGMVSKPVNCVTRSAPIHKIVGD